MFPEKLQDPVSLLVSGRGGEAMARLSLVLPEAAASWEGLEWTPYSEIPLFPSRTLKVSWPAPLQRVSSYSLTPWLEGMDASLARKVLKTFPESDLSHCWFTKQDGVWLFWKQYHKQACPGPVLEL